MVMIYFIFDLYVFYFYAMRSLNKRVSDTVWYGTFGNIFPVIPMTCRVEILVWMSVVYELWMIFRVRCGGMGRRYVVQLTIISK